jgi:hypothetical protein
MNSEDAAAQATQAVGAGDAAAASSATVEA